MGLREWSEWRVFPDPRNGEELVAPFGPGCYELRHRRSRQLILFGSGGHAAERMTSLLPAPLGCGTRKNAAKRDHVFAHLGDVEYRTISFLVEGEATEFERGLKLNRSRYFFPT